MELFIVSRRMGVERNNKEERNGQKEFPIIRVLEVNRGFIIL
jgi:hypothetical protein